MNPNAFLPGSLVSTELIENTCGVSPSQASSVVAFLELRSLVTSVAGYKSFVNKILTLVVPEIWQDPPGYAKRLRAELLAKRNRYNEPLHVDTVRLYIRPVVHLLDWLRDRDEITGPAFAEAKRRLKFRNGNGGEREAPKTLSVLEFVALINRARLVSPKARYSSLDLSALLHLHMHAGLRSGEALRLSWGELDMPGRQIELAPTAHRCLKNWRARRVVPMTATLWHCLELLRKSRLEAGGEVAGAAMVMNPLIKGHPFGWRPWVSATVLRHCFATALASCENIRDHRILELMGHHSLTVTRRHYIGRPVEIPGFEPAVFA